MNKKDIIDRLNKININQNFKLNQINLPSLQIRKIAQKSLPKLLEKAKELFQIPPSKGPTDFSLLSQAPTTAKNAVQTILNRQEIHKVIRQEALKIAEKEEKKAPKKSISTLLSALNRRPALKIQKSAPSVQRHITSFPAISNKNPEKKGVFSFSASRQDGKQAFLTKDEKPILQNLNQNFEINTPLYFHPQNQKTYFQIKERNHFEKTHSFLKEKTFLPLPAPQRQAAQSPHLLKVMAPVLFPKPERDALFSILKDIQNKVSGTKKVLPPVQQVKQFVSAGRNSFYASLRKTTR